jgi:hypothetical protein
MLCEQHRRSLLRYIRRHLEPAFAVLFLEVVSNIWVWSSYAVEYMGMPHIGEQYTVIFTVRYSLTQYFRQIGLGRTLYREDEKEADANNPYSIQPMAPCTLSLV